MSSDYAEMARLMVAGRRHLPTVPFTPDAVRTYLDTHIVHWRNVRDKELVGEGVWPSPLYVTAVQYLDAYQAMRTALFGRPLGHES